MSEFDIHNFRVIAKQLGFIAGSNGVTSFNSRTGSVSPAANDYTWSQIDKTISSLADIVTKSHTVLSDIGTNTHAQIDTHIADATKHFTEASIDHGSVAGLTDDDHSQYALLAGRGGGQTLIGGTSVSDKLVLKGNTTGGYVSISDAIQINGSASIGSAYTGTFPSVANSLMIEGRLGVGVDPTVDFEISKNTTSGVYQSMHNLGIAAGSYTKYTLFNDNDAQFFQIEAFPSANTGTVLGISRSKTINLKTYGANAFFVRTQDVAPLYFGTNDTLALAIDTSQRIGVGTSNFLAYSKLQLYGTASSLSGPHLTVTSSTDAYPLLHMFNWDHDNVYLLFDAYYDGSYRSSDAGSNFAIAKTADQLRFWYDSGIAAGSALTWNTGITMSKDGITSIKQEAVIAPTLVNSWVNYGSSYVEAGYWKDSNGVVHLRGLIKDGTVGSAAFTLPSGYYPSAGTRLFVVISNNAIGRVHISTLGQVTPQSPSSNAWVSLDGISFETH